MCQHEYIFNFSLLLLYFTSKGIAVVNFINIYEQLFCTQTYSLLTVWTYVFYGKRILAEKQKLLINVGEIDYRCQFQQHFTNIFSIGKFFVQLFFTYSFALWNFMRQNIIGQKLLLKCWWNWLLVYLYLISKGKRTDIDIFI